MPKTRQQRLAEQRAGHPPSPPQFLENKPKPRGPKRTRAKTPSATVAAGPAVPAAQSAVQGEPQALLHVWVDAGLEASGRPVDDPTHQISIPSSLVPELVTLIENLRNQNKRRVPKASSKSSLDQLTPSQEMAEPEPAQHPTANKLPNGKKSAFRRNPLLPTSTMFKSQLVEPSLDTSAADGISSLQVNSQSTQEGTVTPETPRGSKWRIGNLFQSACIIKQHLGFGPLAPVLESPETSSQPTAAIITQVLTGTAAPAQPKKQSSPLTSARENRARNRRHNDPVIKPVTPTAAAKIPSGKASRAKEPSPESGKSDEEECPAVDSPAETKASAAGPAIRWPSRSLDRMNQNKRKRWGDPVATPSPEGGSYGLGAADSQRNSEDGGTEQQPAKIRRTRESGVFSSQVAGHPNTARPYEYQGGNVFAEYEAAQKAANTATGEQALPKTPIAITNPTGTFKVPSPGDSDWSDSGSEEEEDNAVGMETMIPSRITSGEFAAANQKYRPSKPSDPQQILALRKAREKALRYKPRNPSRLCQSSRAYPSPPVADTGPQVVEKAVKPEAAGATRFAAYEDWWKTAPPAVTAVLETMEVDSNFAGQAFKSGLDNFINPR